MHALCIPELAAKGVEARSRRARAAAAGRTGTPAPASSWLARNFRDRGGGDAFAGLAGDDIAAPRLRVARTRRVASPPTESPFTISSGTLCPVEAALAAPLPDEVIDERCRLHFRGSPSTGWLTWLSLKLVLRYRIVRAEEIVGTWRDAEKPSLACTLVPGIANDPGGRAPSLVLSFHVRTHSRRVCR